MSNKLKILRYDHIEFIWQELTNKMISNTTVISFGILLVITEI